MKVLETKKRKTLIIAAAVLLVAVVAIASQGLNSGNMMSAIDEQGVLVNGPSADGVLAISEQGVPLDDSYGASNPYITEVLDLVNAERAKNGAGPLVTTGELNAAAAVRAVEVSKSFAHYRPDGSLCFTVLTDFNISSSARAENIAGNFRSPEQVVSAWMKSEGHKKNILNASYNKIGIGVFTDSAGKLSWVQLFTD